MDSSAQGVPSILWVHNFPTHYTVGLFQLISERMAAEFLFFSGGGERYWLKEHGVQPVSFPHENLRGIEIFGTRLALSLPMRLLSRNYDAAVQCVDGKFALPVTYVAARIRRKPFVLYTGIWMRVGTLVHRLAFPMLRHIYRNADAVVVYGEHVKRYLLSEGVKAERIFVEPHAVDNQLYRQPVGDEEKNGLYDSLGVTRGTKLILYLGRIEPEKGLEHLVRALASLAHSDAVLVLAGVGSDETRLKRLVADLGLVGRVRWPGYVPPYETARYYATAWVFVLPSITTRRDKETWGLVVNEAFNQALPVIATDAVGAAAGGLIENGINGLVVPEGDEGPLAHALDTVLADEGLRSAMGESAKRKIASWNHETAAEVVEHAVRFAIDSRGAPDANPVERTKCDPRGVFVVIPVHNRIGYTRACLQALARQTIAGFHIVVVDDGSTDGTSQMIRDEFPSVQVLTGDGTLWWTGATNRGVVKSLKRGATHVLTLNDDTSPTPDFVERLVAAATREPNALIGALFVDDATGESIYGGEWINWATASARNLLHDSEHRGADLIETTHYPGRGLLIPASVFRRIGVFDAAHFPQGAADYDFTHRARRAGYRIYCDRSAVLRIHPNATGDFTYRRLKGWGNYRRHLFDIKGGGNLKVFSWYALKNCPFYLLPLCLTVGLARRLGGYLLEWLIESMAAMGQRGLQQLSKRK